MKKEKKQSKSPKDTQAFEDKLKIILFPKDYLKNVKENITVPEFEWKTDEKDKYIRYLRTMMKEQKQDSVEKAASKAKVHQSDKMTSFLQDCYMKDTAPYSDLEIRMDNELFRTHKLVVACYIPYLFCEIAAMKKSKTVKKINLRGVTTKAFREVYRYMYTGVLDPKHDNFVEVLEAMIKFRIDTEAQLWTELYEVKLGSVTSKLVLRARAARKFHWLNYLQELNRVLAYGFDNLLLSSEFLQLEAVELRDIISQDEIGTQNEVVIFLAVLKWLNHDWKNRKQHAYDLFKEVRFPLMNLTELFACYNPPIIKDLSVQIPEVEALIAKSVLFHHSKESSKKLESRKRDYKPQKKETLHLWTTPSTPDMTQVRGDYIKPSKPSKSQKPSEFKECKCHLKHPKDQPCEVAAAVKIQANFRGHLIRKELIEAHTKGPKKGDVPRVSSTDTLPMSFKSLEMQPQSELDTLGLTFKHEFNPDRIIITSVRDVGSSVSPSGSSTSHSSTTSVTISDSPNAAIKKTDKQLATGEVPKANEKGTGKTDIKPLPLPKGIEKSTSFKSFESPNKMSTWKDSLKPPQTAKKSPSGSLSSTGSSLPKTPSPIDSTSMALGTTSSPISPSESSFLLFEEVLNKGTMAYVCNMKDEKIQQWAALGLLSKPLPHDTVTISDGYNVYFTGGILVEIAKQKINLKAAKSFLRLDLNSKAIVILPSMTEKRVMHSTVPLSGKLYAVGGKSMPSRVNNTVECYDFSKQQWEILSASMNVPRFGAACTSYMGLLWIINGITQASTGKSRLLKDVIVYNPKTNTWMRLKNKLPVATAFSTAIVHNNELYLIGGRTASRGKMENYDGVWKFNGATKTWLQVNKLNKPRRNIFCYSIGNKIYAIGGIDDDNISSKLCEVFDTSNTSKGWTEEQALPVNTPGNLIVSLNSKAIRKI